jgi:hypothetical protein
VGIVVVKLTHASLMEGGRRIKNIAKKRSVSGLTPGGRFLSFPMRALVSSSQHCGHFIVI